jgi:hypothetical protein
MLDFTRAPAAAASAGRPRRAGALGREGIVVASNSPALAGIAVAPTPAGFVFHFNIAATRLTAPHVRASVRPYCANPPQYDEILSALPLIFDWDTCCVHIA